MKIKIQKVKFIRNIIIGIIALIIVAFIVNMAPGFKRDKYQDVINLVIGDENVTEKLKNPIYIDEKKGIYLSKEDILQFFDKTLYFDEQEKRIITTSEVSVASMEIGEKEINISSSTNTATNDTLYTIIYNNNIMYLPIQELKSVYNIKIEYKEEAKIVIIDKLNNGMIEAEVAEETDIRFKPRRLSKKVGTLKIGDSVSAFYTTSKGWRLIRTSDGTIGYVKANMLANEYIIRQDMEQEVETKEINSKTDNNTYLTVEDNKILIKDLLEITENGILLKNSSAKKENIQQWANLTINKANLHNYTNRTEIIDNIVIFAMKNDINGINIKVDGTKESERLVIELAPRLREIGIKTNIIASENINLEIYSGIVNYIIKNNK